MPKAKADTAHFLPLPTIDAATLTYERFLREFALPKQPCLITNVGTSWAARDWSIEYFLSHEGVDLEHEVSIADGGYAGSREVDTTAGEALRLVLQRANEAAAAASAAEKGGSCSQPAYLSAWNYVRGGSAALQNDFVVPSLFERAPSWVRCHSSATRWPLNLHRVTRLPLDCRCAGIATEHSLRTSVPQRSSGARQLSRRHAVALHRHERHGLQDARRLRKAASARTRARPSRFTASARTRAMISPDLPARGRTSRRRGCGWREGARSGCARTATTTPSSRAAWPAAAAATTATTATARRSRTSSRRICTSSTRTCGVRGSTMASRCAAPLEYRTSSQSSF